MDCDDICNVYLPIGFYVLKITKKGFTNSLGFAILTHKTRFYNVLQYSLLHYDILRCLHGYSTTWCTPLRSVSRLFDSHGKIEGVKWARGVRPQTELPRTIIRNRTHHWLRQVMWGVIEYFNYKTNGDIFESTRLLTHLRNKMKNVRVFRV